MPTHDLRPLLADRATRPQSLVDALNAELVPGAVERYNSEFGPRHFGRLLAEEIPIEKTRLSAFRGRLGLLIEYALAVTIDKMLEEDYGDEFRLSAEVVNKYPDFYLRDSPGAQLLRVDFKVLHDESDEYSARLTTPVAELTAGDDLVLYSAWRWGRSRLFGTELRYSEIPGALVVSALAIATERDERLRILGGTVAADGTPMLAGGNKDTNYGKINRIVHPSRRGVRLDPSVEAFLEFVGRYVPGAAEQVV